MSERAQITPAGPFSLRAAAEFGFGPNEGRPPPFHGAMRMAFPVDGGRGYAGAVLRREGEPDAAQPVDVKLTLRDAEPDLALVQVARTVSLDQDGEQFTRLGESDPVLGALQRAHPGQRPVLFHSPYEAAAWSIISARRPASLGAKLRTKLAERLGATFELDGHVLHALPQPSALAEIPDDFPGLGQVKAQRLRALADAARQGVLDVPRLHEIGPERAFEELQLIPGIGPFYAGLIVLRGSGFADAISPVPEPKGSAHAARFYGLDGPLDAPAFAALAERWRPFRTWATVLIRLAGDRGTRLS